MMDYVKKLSQTNMSFQTKFLRSVCWFVRKGILRSYPDVPERKDFGGASALVASSAKQQK
eukprot:3750662-Amphidinium_carterae.2